MFFFQEGFTYRNFLLDALAIFFFFVWFWLSRPICFGATTFQAGLKQSG